MPSPGSHGGFSPVDDSSATPVLLPGSPVELDVSGTTPEVVPPVVLVPGSPVSVAVADGSTVVVAVVGEPVVGGSFVVVSPIESDTEPVGVVVVGGASLVPVPVIVEGPSVVLPGVPPVEPWVPLALASVPPVESPQPANPSPTTHPTNPIDTQRFIRPS